MADLTTRRVRAAAGIVAAFLVVSISADSSSEVTAPLASEIVAGATAAAVDSSAAAVAPISSAGLDRQDDFARRFIRRIDGDARVFGYRALRAALSAVGDDDASWNEEMSDLGDATADKLFQAAADSATDGLRRSLEGSFIRNLTLSYRSPFSSSGARVSGDALAALWGDADRLLFAQFGGGADFGDDGEDDDSDKYGSVGFGLRGKLGGAVLGGNIFGDVTAEGYRRHSFGLEARHRGGLLRANWYFGDAHLADGRTLEASGRVPGLTDWAEFGAEFSQWDNTADDGGDEMEAGYRLSVFPRDGVRLNFKQNKEEGESSSFEVLAEFGWHLDAAGLAGAAIRLGDASQLDARLDGIVERDREFRKKTRLSAADAALASAASAAGQVGPDCGSGTADGDSCVVSDVESSLGALVVTLYADGSCETEIDGEAAVSRRGRLLAGGVNVCESAAAAAEIDWSPGFGFGNATAEPRILTGTAGEAFSHNLADDFSDAEGDLTCELAAGALPAGLALDETACVLSGTFPAAAGLLSFTIHADEANGTTHSAIYMLNRHPTGETAITVNAVESRVFAHDAAGDFNDADGDYLTCEVKAGSSLPEWLSQGGLGGCALTGRPTTVVSAAFTLVIGDGADGRAEAGYAVSVIAIATARADEAALRQAAKIGNISEVMRLLGAGNADVNAPGERGFTALMWAARNGHGDVVRELLGAAGIDVNRQKNKGWTALILAIFNGHTQVAELLLGPLGVAVGIDVNVQNDNGYTALDWANQKNLGSIRNLLLAAGGRCNNVCRPPASPTGLTANVEGRGDTADVVLAWAVSTGAIGYIIYRDDVKIADIVGGERKTHNDEDVGVGVYTYAIAANSDSDGASGISAAVTVTVRSPLAGFTATYNVNAGAITLSWTAVDGASGYIVSRDDVEVYRLNDDAAMNWTDEFQARGEYRYGIAAIGADGEVLDRAEDSATVPNHPPEAVEASQAGDEAVALKATESRVFAHDAAADFNDADGDDLTCEIKDGSSLPDWASQSGLGGCVLTGTPPLAVASAFTLMVDDGFGGRAEAGYEVSVIALSVTEADESALRQAAKIGNVGKVASLLEAGNVDVNARAPSPPGHTALILAAQYGHANVVVELRAAADIKVNFLNNYGNTALLEAARYGHAGVVEELLAFADINVNFQERWNGYMALMWAARNGHADIVEELLTFAGINVNLRSKWKGNTALMWAARNGRAEIVNGLLDVPGIGVNLRNNNGDTALDWANRRNRESIRERLIAVGGRCNNSCHLLVPPSGLTANVGDSGAPANVVVTWAVSTGATGYIIYRDDVKIADIVGGETTTYTDADAGVGVHSYTIAATNSGFASEISAAVTVTIRFAGPADFAAVYAAAAADVVGLSWTAVDGARGYIIYRNDAEVRRLHRGADDEWSDGFLPRGEYLYEIETIGAGGEISARSAAAVTVLNHPPVAKESSKSLSAVVDLAFAGHNIADNFSDADRDVLICAVKDGAALPAGLSLGGDAGCELSGTPTAIGSLTVTIAVDDGNEGGAEAAYQIEIISAERALIAAAKSGDVAEIQRLRAAGNVRVNARDAYSLTALMWAAMRGKANAVKELGLFDNINADMIDWRLRRTALMWAITHDRIAAVEALSTLDRINVNLKNSKYGNTALMIAARTGRDEIVNKLSAFTDIDANLQNDIDQGKTALDYANFIQATSPKRIRIRAQIREYLLDLHARCHKNCDMGDPRLLSAPTGLRAERSDGGAGGEVVLEWDATAYATGYIIYRDDVQIAEITSDTTTTYTDSEAGVGMHSYTIAATNSGIESARSAPYPVPPLPLADFKATYNADEDRVALSWTAVSEASGYIIYRDDAEVRRIEDDGDAASWTDGFLVRGEYRYEIAAIGADSATPARSAALATVPNHPPEAKDDVSRSLDAIAGLAIAGRDIAGDFSDADGDVLSCEMKYGAALPAGVSLGGDTGCELSGTPTAAGSFVFTIEAADDTIAAADDHGGVAEAEYTLRVMSLWEAGSALREAARVGDMVGLARLLSLGVDVNGVNSYGETALIVAAQNCQEGAAADLLDAAGVNVNLADNYGDTALLWAAYSDCDKVLGHLLVESDISVNEQNVYGETALIAAAANDYLDALRALLGDDRVDVDLPDGDGGTALIWAAQNGSAAAIEALLAEDADASLVDGYGYTALLWASSGGHSAAVTALSAATAGINVNHQDSGGKTALIWAVINNDEAAVTALLDVAGIDKEALDNGGDTALTLARRLGYTHLADLLTAA